MRSMTGFGKAEKTNVDLNFGFRVELSSINRKQQEFKCILPHELAMQESAVRSTLGQKVSRGSVTVRVSYADGFSLDNNVTVDAVLAQKIISAAKQIAEQSGIPAEIRISDILMVPGVLKSDATGISAEETEKLLIETLEIAIAELLKSREREGEHLKADIASHLQNLKDCLEKIVPLVRDMPKIQFEKMRQRVQEHDFMTDPNDERLMKELVLYIDKLDVNEEITRLHAHFAQFDSILGAKNNEPAGRQLDFLVQETFREINTLGNKAGSTQVSPLIVTMKTELEKIREQVQNIE